VSPDRRRERALLAALAVVLLVVGHGIALHRLASSVAVPVVTALAVLFVVIAAHAGVCER